MKPGPAPPRRSGPDPNLVRTLSLGLALLTLLVYLPGRQQQFVNFDDPEYVTENRVVQAGLTWTGVKWAFTGSHASNWHPVTWLSHMLDCEWFGLDAGAHKLVNALLHAVNAGLLLALLFRMTGALWPSVLAAALFAWHPLRVESVAWVSERKDVLCSLFGLLSLWAYVGYAQASDHGTTRPGDHQAPKPRDHQATASAPRFTSHASRWYSLAVVALALGLMSKPMLVTWPFLFLLLDYWPLRRIAAVPGAPRSGLARLALEKWPFFLLAVVSGLVTFLAQRAESVQSLAALPLGLRLSNSLVSYLRYLWKFVWPVDLSVFYPWPKSWPWPQVGLAVVLLVLVSALAWRWRHRRPHYAVGWAWFVGTLVPVIGLVQVGEQSLADRYTYLPSIGLCLAVAFEAGYWVERFRPKRRVVALVLAAAVLVACLLGTEKQLTYWKDSQTLFEHALAVTNDNPTAHINLGSAFETAGRFEDARREYEAALRLNPAMPAVHNNLGNVLRQCGRFEEALAQYRESLRLRERPLAYENLGELLAQLGRFDEASSDFDQATRLDPSRPRPHRLKGQALVRQSRSQQALAEFRTALRLDANDVPSLLGLARVLAAHPNPNLRNGDEAIAAAMRAILVEGRPQPQSLDTLAMAYAEKGAFTEARETVQQAIASAKAAGQTNAVVEMEQRLRLYEGKQPYRDTLTSPLTDR